MTDDDRSRAPRDEDLDSPAPISPQAPDAAAPPVERKATREEVAARAKLVAGEDLLAVDAKASALARSRLPRDFKDEADDIARKAIVEALDPLYKAWDPAKETFQEHVNAKVNRLVEHHMRSADVRLRSHDEHAASREEAADPSAEKALAAKQLIELCAARIEQRFGKKALHLFRNMGEPPRELEAELGMTGAQIHALRRTLTLYCTRLIAEMNLTPQDVRLRRSEEIVALEREIEELLPKRARRSSGCLVSSVIIAITIGLLSLMAWSACHR